MTVPRCFRELRGNVKFVVDLKMVPKKAPKYTKRGCKFLVLKNSIGSKVWLWSVIDLDTSMSSRSR